MGLEEEAPFGFKGTGADLGEGVLLPSTTNGLSF